MPPAPPPRPLLAAGQAAGAPRALDIARLGPDGLGPVGTGMTVAQPGRPPGLRVTITRRSGACAVLEQAGPGDGVSFLLADGVVRSASVAIAEPNDLDDATTPGLRPTSEESEVRRIYGARFFTGRDPQAGGLQLVYRPRPAVAPTRRLVFTTGRLGGLNGRYVVAMSVGQLPEARAGLRLTRRRGIAAPAQESGARRESRRGTAMRIDGGHRGQPHIIRLV